MKREPQTKYQAIRDIAWEFTAPKVTKAAWMHVNRACKTLGLNNGETHQVLNLTGMLTSDGRAVKVLEQMGIKYPA